MCKVDPYIRLNANNNGETKCVIFVDNISSARKQLEKFTSTIIAAYPFINGFGANISVHKLSDLSCLPCVKAISSHTTVTTTECGFSPPHRGIDVPAAYDAGIFGEGVTTAVIDTGVRPHIDLLMPKNRTEFVDFIDGQKLAYDDNGHGTAVSSIICGNGLLSNGKYKGIAPKSNLIHLKAISSDGQGGTFAILEAMQWIYTNKDKFNIKVVCMSFGAEPVLNGVDPLSLGAQVLWQSGVTVVASAGNSGPRAGTVKSPGTSPLIITVGGASIEDGDVGIPDFSSRGPCGKFSKPDIIAPSVNIACCGIDDDYTFFSGTSMAAPIVAGAAALMLSKNPNLSPDRIKELLLQNATKLPFDENTAGYGLLSLAFINDI